MTTTISFDNRSYFLHHEMIAWCDEFIGKNPSYRTWVYQEPGDWRGLGTWCVSSVFGNTFFYFKHEQDATLFALRWASHENSIHNL